MKTLEIEIAIMDYFNIRTNLIVPNVSWGMGLHECDILSLSKIGYATEIEIKVSKTDLLKDKWKNHGHYHNYIARLYFAVPEKLKDVALSNIPERAGLFIIKEIYYENYSVPSIDVVKIRSCKRNKKAHKWTDKERLNLARLGTMRILNLKKKINKLTKL